MSYVKEERSLGELFSELTQEVQRLFRQEVDLAKLELSQKISRMVKDVTFLSVGIAVGYAAFLALAATVIIILGTFMPWWLSSLLVTALLAGGSYALVRKGLDDMRRGDLAPRQTLETLKEDKEWMKERM
ncbi:MAG: phage holin family protein [Alphaproteobacteria bacterium]|uniref:Phage holin family protein n=1 Tax=Candidatus Nitrobium versatile TaxID=2884831 RepID=A0A953J1T3_9BACT|nr:phage holin family protein [Candidatus Nitrobium versatile]